MPADRPGIVTASSSATATETCKGNVLISGSYAGEYNAYHAAKWGIRGVVLNDAGIGKDNAGIVGLAYLDKISLPAATADAQTCHIADGDHMLSHGIVSYINRSAEMLGCKRGQSVRECAELMRLSPLKDGRLPEIAGGKRFIIRDSVRGRKIICLDAAPMLEPQDAGSIAITGSHAALFRGQRDDVIKPDVFAIFFSDAGVGLDGAGIARLPTLDDRNIAAGTASVASARIGDSRDIYQQGTLSYVNKTAAQLGGRPGMSIRDFVERLSG